MSRGCVASEFALGTAPMPGNFPRRNRLISGLALGVVVVEAAMRSGSLLTARSALEQGPRRVRDPRIDPLAALPGCHWLIKEGATLVECAEDVLMELGWKPTGPAAGAAGRGEPERDPLLRAMGHAPVSLDELARATGMEVARIAARITHLELAGRVAALAGGRFQRLVRNAAATAGRDDA